MIAKLMRLLELLITDKAIIALVTWPKFSLAAYKIISRLIRAGVEPKIVIDVGANAGQFAVAANKLYPGATIYPIEPDPRVADLLQKNVGKAIAKNVMITAVGDLPGIAQFHVNRDPQVSSLLKLGADRIESFPNSDVIEQINVPVNTLDTLFSTIILDGPILLKIDAQGFEDRVIRGASQLLKRVSWILIEVSFSKLYEDEKDFISIYRLLQTYGYEFVRPMNFHISPKTGDIIEMDALFKRVT